MALGKVMPSADRVLLAATQAIESRKATPAAPAPQAPTPEHQ
jgi:hypothetical protein